MEEFYNQSAKAQEKLMGQLARKALLQYDIDPNANVTLLSYRENAVFLVETGITKYALRVHRHGYHSDAALQSELLWMEALTNSGVLTPPIIRGKTGKSVHLVSSEGIPAPHQVDLLAWVDGKTPEPKTIVSTFFTLGKENARLHRHAELWARPKDFTRHAWDEVGMLEHPIWGQYEDLGRLSSEQLNILDQAREIVKSKLEGYGKSSDRFGLIHADLMPENLMVNGDDVNIIDFDDGGFGWFMYDFATALAVYQAESFYKEIYQSWLKGYRSTRSLSEEDVDMIPTFLVCRGLVVLGWLHTRRNTEFVQKHASDLTTLILLMTRGYVKSKGKEVSVFSKLSFVKEMILSRMRKVFHW